MYFHRSTADWLVGLIGVSCLLCGDCAKEKPKPPPAPLSGATHSPCDSGESRDPPHQQARPAIQALRGKDYDTAVRLFGELLAKYPESASLRVWLGDACLGQGTVPSIQAALDAYGEALALDARGCKLRERETFFLYVGTADAQIRQQHAELALAKLADAERKWPDTAEVAYQRARAECQLGQRDACFVDLKAAFTLARSAQHPRFSRSHHSSDRLLERAATEPELEALRKEPRYRALLALAGAGDAGTVDREPAGP